MKILIFGDIHGRDFWKEAAKNVDKFNKVIFLGDFHDPYPGQVSKEKSRHMLRDELVPFIEENIDKVICIEGNHDLNYLSSTPMANRFDSFHREEIYDLIRKLPFRLAYQVDSYLFSHAGITKGWLEFNDISILDVLADNVSFNELFQVSEYRGGMNRYGSCVWCDLQEFIWARKPEGYYQIIGHTQLEDQPIMAKEFACLDCRKAFMLDTEKKTLREYNEKFID